jgi:hypothetical protein
LHYVDAFNFSFQCPLYRVDLAYSLAESMPSETVTVHISGVNAVAARPILRHNAVLASAFLRLLHATPAPGRSLERENAVLLAT